MEEERQNLHKPIYGVPRNHKNSQSQRDLSCYYGLRENPKKKTQESFGLESPELTKKMFFRCGDCGKGFRYEKCLSNHQAGMHLSTNHRVYEASIKSLCSSFGLVRKMKRSRVIRYKKTPLSCSFNTFLESPSVFAANDEELQVAECLILLSKSSPKLVVDGLKLVSEAMGANPETPRCCLSNKKTRKAGEFKSGVSSKEQNLMEERFSRYERLKEPAEFESWFSSDEQKLVKDEISSDETSEEPASFLGEKSGLDQWKLKKSCDFESGFYRTELGVGDMECSDSDTGSDNRNVEHQCKLCNKVFSSYQALGGHQTFHRMSKSKNKKNRREESVEEPEVESVTEKKEKKRHECSICSKEFQLGSCFRWSQEVSRQGKTIENRA
ncbi:hypothetical protein EUTSA_v10002882mg [Eutrema salsugineum]|uniref:C2H2-type domain-containing protein n=1 Tax=Eutrema salsugineum TaxID=72664 RepID=V4L4S7_EUTSA|nr:uncharacterized protein LOC18013921 [Eutrema salsugineum]ESQ37297.1 hypothetical protein EUTSA_v10002882mg [Eutrema salsugineum]